MRRPCARLLGLRIGSSSRPPTWPRADSGSWKRPSRASWQLTGNGSRPFRRSWTRSRRRASTTPSSASERTLGGSRPRNSLTGCGIDTCRPSISCLPASMNGACDSWRPRCRGAIETVSRSRPSSRLWARQSRLRQLRALGAEIATLSIRVGQVLGEEHHAFGICVVMANAQCVSEFVDRGLHGPLDELRLSIAPKLGQRDDRPSTLNVRVSEDERQSEFWVAQLDVRDRDDPIAIGGFADPIEGRCPVPFRVVTEGSSRQRLRARDPHLSERRELEPNSSQDGRVDSPDWLEGEDHPLTTPSGTNRATIFVSPAPSATRTTSSTFLYAPGASSTIPAREAARR